MSNPAASGADDQMDSSSSVDVARQRFLVNVGSNVFYVAANSLLMFWYVPFLVRHLGVAAYGMVPLANMLVMYASIISTSLNISISRFLAIDINRRDTAAANRTFNTALALSLLGCGILLVPAGALAYFFPVLFNVPSGLETPTQFMFAGVVFTTLAAIISGTFAASSLITHRFDLRNVVRALTSISRVGIVAICFMLWPASLWHVTAGFVLSALIGLAGDILVWRKVTPQLRIDRREVDLQQSRALLNLSGWASINQVGLLLLMQVDLLIVNALFGAEMTGRYGSLLLFPALIHMVMDSAVTVLSPAIAACYAVGDTDGVKRIASRATRLLGIGLALPVGLLCGFSAPLLNLWLGPDFVQLDILLTLLVGHLAVNLATRPLGYVLTAYSRMRVQGVVTLGLGLANILLADALARWSGWGAAGVAVAAAIVWTLKNVVVLSSYTARLMNLSWWTFYTPLVAGALGTVAVGVAGRILSQAMWPTDWLSLGLMAGSVSIVYCIIAYAVGLSRADRSLLRSLVERKLSRA